LTYEVYVRCQAGKGEFTCLLLSHQAVTVPPKMARLRPMVVKSMIERGHGQYLSLTTTQKNIIVGFILNDIKT